jgi:hypothetical protein
MVVGFTTTCAICRTCYLDFCNWLLHKEFFHMHNIFVLINVLIFIQLNLVINELVISSDSFKLTLFSHFKYASSVVCCSGYLSYNQIIKIKKTHHQLYFIFNNHIIYILLLPSTGSWKNVGISHKSFLCNFLCQKGK